MNDLSKTPFGKYRRDSGELDVFEAARYFSDDVDRVGFGIQRLIYGHAHTQKRHSLEIPPRQQLLPNDHDQAVHTQVVNKKLLKNSSTSPAAKLANYLNSLLLQITSKKKSKCMNNNDYTFKYVQVHATNFPEEPKDCDQVLEDNKNLSYNNNYNNNNNNSSDVTWRCNRRTKFIGRDKKDWFFENKWVLNRSNGIGGKWSFERRDAGKVELDGDDDDDGEESDSSSDLFELKNMYGIDDALLMMSHELPVCGTTLSG